MSISPTPRQFRSFAMWLTSHPKATQEDLKMAEVMNRAATWPPAKRKAVLKMLVRETTRAAREAKKQAVKK